MHTFRSVSITLTLLLTLGFMSTEALAKRHTDGDSSTSTHMESSLSIQSVHDLAKTYLNDFQAVDPYITFKDLVIYIKNLNASSVTEAETALQAYLISLQGSTTNHEPSIDGSPVVSVNEGEVYQFIPTATDPDGDTLTFSVNNAPGWAVFDPQSGSLSGTLDSNAAGVYENVLISVSDGELSASLSAFTITVNDVVQEPVVVAGPPALAPANISDTTVILTWTQENAVPEGGYDTFIDNVNTSTQYRTSSTSASIEGLDLTQSHCFAVEARYTDTGEYYSSNQVCTVAQQPANQSPLISGFPDTSTGVGESYIFTPIASDPDGDTLSFSADNLPTWINLDSTTGTLTGVPTEQEVGSYPNITILVTDGSATVSLAPFTLLVEAALDPTSASTSLSWLAPSTRSDGTALAMSEIEGYRIYMGETESALSLITDINDSSLMSYALTNLSAGDYYFAVTAYDMDGNESAFSNIVYKSVL